METIFIHLNYLGESNQEKLDAYRNIGSVRHLKRLRQQEIRRNKLLKRTGWALKNLVLGAIVVLDIWIIASWIDIGFHNCQPNPVYQAWNFFTLFF